MGVVARLSANHLNESPERSESLGIPHRTVTHLHCDALAQECHLEWGGEGRPVSDQLTPSINDEAGLTRGQVWVGPGYVSLNDVPALAHEWDCIVDDANSWNSSEDLVCAVNAELGRGRAVELVQPPSTL